MAVRRPLNDDISVIIPTYGRHQMLLRALDSIIGQSTRIREVIVVDDGSPNPITIPDRYNDHFPVKLVQHERNRGAAAARNTGLRLASGRWITFLDSDDVWLPGTLERRLADAQAHLNATGAALSCYVCGFEVVWMNANRRERRKPVGTSSLKDLVSGCWFAPGSCAIMLREPVLATVGPVDEDLRRLEDLDWFIRLGLAGGQIVANDLIGVRVEIRTKPGSSTLKASSRHLIARYIAPGGPQRLPFDLRRRLRAYLYLEQAASEWYEGRRGRALVTLGLSLAFVPRMRLHLGRFWK